MSSPRLSALVLVSLLGCGGESTPTDGTTDSFDRSALLAHLGQNVLLPSYAAFDTQAGALPAAIGAYCAALDAGDVGVTREAAQAAWADAIDAWERAEAVLVGPAAMDNKTLRERIYSWPLFASCDVDRDTASRWADPASYDLATKSLNRRSLTAVEYLLFAGPTHTCAIEPLGWAALGADLPRARCRLAQVLATDVAAAASIVHTAWRADGGDYAGELARAGQSGSSITSAHEGVNRVSDGMFYVDRMVKDMKLGEAAGIAVNSCGTVQQPCLREVELPYADRTTFAIRANLALLREVFTGTTAASDGPGFDDFLIAVGHPELAERMRANLDAAIAKADALPASFLGALSASYASVVETHAAVNVFTDDLKTQFLTVLALEIPDEVAADND